MVDKIIKGINRFQCDVYPGQKHLFHELANSQHPDVLFITCSDSRIDPNLITQTRPGELFICRNAGNIVPPHTYHTGGMTASIEYAVGVLGVSHLVLCGHTDCGAMKGALNPEALKEFPHVCEWLGHCDAAARIVRENHSDLPEEAKLQLMIEQNVLAQLRHLQTHPYVASRVNAGKLSMHGWVYDIETGHFKTYKEESKSFEPLLMDKELKSLTFSKR